MYRLEYSINSDEFSELHINIYADNLKVFTTCYFGHYVNGQLELFNGYVYDKDKFANFIELVNRGQTSSVYLGDKHNLRHSLHYDSDQNMIVVKFGYCEHEVWCYLQATESCREMLNLWQQVFDEYKTYLSQ